MCEVSSIIERRQLIHTPLGHYIVNPRPTIFTQYASGVSRAHDMVFPLHFPSTNSFIFAVQTEISTNSFMFAVMQYKLKFALSTY